MIDTIAQMQVLTRVLDTSALRHQVLAHNLANVNTPLYQRLDVKFEEALANHLGGDGDLGEVKPEVVVDRSAVARGDGNTVNLEKEMGSLTKNATLYNAAAHVLASHLAMLRSAITGR
jgi:flagellar basal-body rod protein FlgB